MKKHLIVFAVLTVSAIQATQAPKSSIQHLYDPNYRNIVFLGMDFSMVKLVGDFTEALGVGGEGNAQTKNAYFKSWNNLVSGEREKYNIKKLVNNQNITVDISRVMALNNATPVDSLTGYKEPDYSPAILSEHAKKYDTGNGLGVVLLIECFNKNDQKATIDFVVIDMTTNEIVMLQKLKTTPRGSGLRNYWAGAIYETFREVEKNFLKTWKNNYNWN